LRHETAIWVLLDGSATLGGGGCLKIGQQCLGWEDVQVLTP